MKAVVLKEPKKVTIEERKIPANNEKALIKITSVGICGSDISAYQGRSRFGIFPRILGHEAVGRIEEIPDNQYGLKPGDMVVIEPYCYCGKCYPCTLGRTNCCENLGVIGVHKDGAFAEYLVHDINLLHKIPKNIPSERITLVEPLTVSMQAIKRVNVKEGEFVVISGAGTIGILAALYAKYLKAIPIIIDPLESRLEIAKKMGIEYVINPSTCSAIDAIKSITNGRMAEVVIEASGSERAVRNSIDYVAYAGRISLVGYPFNEVSLPTYVITKKELDIRGSRNSLNLFREAIKLIVHNSLNVEPIISAIIDFYQLPEYIEIIANNPANYLKVIALLNKS